MKIEIQIRKARDRVSGFLIRNSSFIIRPPLLMTLLRASIVLAMVMRGAFAQSPSDTARQARPVIVLEIEGTAEFMAKGAPPWRPVVAGFELQAGDRVRTGDRSRLTLRWSDLSQVRIPERVNFQLDPPPDPKGQHGLTLFRGLLYFFHRDKPGEFRCKTPTASAAVRGTEFILEATDDRTVVTLLEGEVELSNDQGQVQLKSGQQGLAETGRAPTNTTAAISVVNVVQWCLYYPAVLDPAELELDTGGQQALSESLAHYRAGDLLQALAHYPVNRQPGSSSEQVYLAGLLLSVGQVEQAEQLLDSLNPADSTSERARRLADAVRKLIAAVQLKPDSNARFEPRLATEWLAESYTQQSGSKLSEALAAARRSVAISAGFSFGQARLAELEFSFGRTAAARVAVDKSLQLAPRNAQALALRGFLLAAEYKIADAIDSFDQAIAVDSALGNAWLGRGLCQIRQGQVLMGRENIQTAVVLEPQRAVLRSYLSKAWSEAGDLSRAVKEIQLAKDIDANDPTAWLYSALLHAEHNRVNEAVADLETSQQLYDNRHLYRSRLLLDQDRAVRGANLANIYRDAGMLDASRREAAGAVNADYANYSAHWFLANSYNQLRDPNQINIRYETPWLSEFLLANLLAPVGAGTLSQTLSQQEYSKLFERDHLGLASSTEYLSDGSWTEDAVHYGNVGSTSYALEAFYRSHQGQRPNNDQEQFTGWLQFKEQITPRDSVYLQAIYYNAEAGDLTPYYDQTNANRFVQIKERQEPIVLAGYHHEWAPGSHTLFLAGRADDTLEVSNPQQTTAKLVQSPVTGRIVRVEPVVFAQDYRSAYELYTGELQHIWEGDPHRLIVGTRYQAGEFRTENRQTSSEPLPGLEADQDLRSDFRRFDAYGYYHQQVAESLLLLAGVSYDYVMFPVNHRYAPISSEEESTDQVSPKAGLVWSPTAGTTLRAAYTRSLGGVSFDQSFRLEPTQIAGFNQAWRSIIPEAVTGASPAPTFETWGVELDHRFTHGTYFGLEAQLLKSKVSRSIGAFLDPVVPPAVPIHVTEDFDYEEKILGITLNHLLGECWSLGEAYRISYADLQERRPTIPETAIAPAEFAASREQKALLHQLELHAIYNHPSGFFAQGQAMWYSQSNRGDPPALPGDDFWQFNLYAGYRFPRRKAELRLGLLNLTGQDYRLNPLNLTAELPRERTLAVNFRFHF
jgi:Tfp pilus assembly protein PilF